MHNSEPRIQNTENKCAYLYIYACSRSVTVGPPKPRFWPSVQADFLLPKTVGTPTPEGVGIVCGFRGSWAVDLGLWPKNPYAVRLHKRTSTLPPPAPPHDDDHDDLHLPEHPRYCYFVVSGWNERQQNHVFAKTLSSRFVISNLRSRKQANRSSSCAGNSGDPASDPTL